MERVANQIRANTIIDYFLQVNFDRKTTVEHFSEQNVPRSTIYRVIKRFTESGSSEFKPIPGRPITVNTKANGKRVIATLKRNPSKSVRSISQTLQITKSTVQNIKVKNQVKSYSKRKVPKYVKDQEERARKGCGWLYKKLVPSGGGFFIVMDDETYVPADPDQVHSKEHYSLVPGVVLPESAKVRPIEKFPRKFLVWQAIAQDGSVSAPYIKIGTMNSDEYLEKCVKKILVPFIKSFKQPVLF